jgi:hypothetical protein
MQDEDKRGNDQDDRESRTQARAEEQHVEQEQILIMIAERTGAPGENEQNLQAHRERQDRGNDLAGHARFEPRNDESGDDHERRHDRRVNRR